MGQRSSKSSDEKNISVSSYMNYINKKNDQIFENNTLRLEKLIISKNKIHHRNSCFNYENAGCLSFGLNMNSSNESITEWRRSFNFILRTHENKWCKEFASKIKKFKIISDCKFIKELKILDYKMSFYYEKKSDIDELIKEDLSFNSSTMEHEKKMDISNDQLESNNFTDLIKNVSFINFSKEVDEFNENKRASLIENEKSNKKKSITGVSYARKLTKSILNEENSVIQNLHFKKAANIINKHLENTENIFGFLKNEFKIYFVNCYENSNCNNLIKNQEKMIKDVQIFINLIADGIYSYYNLKKYRTLYSNNLFTKYNVLNMVISAILKDKLFESILKKQEKIDEQINYDLSLKIDYYSKFGPEKFEIPKKFCLNQTINEIKENDNHSYVPYSNTIEILKGINLINDPIKKINIIMTAAEMIQKEIKDYYEKKGIIYNENIGGDELLSIFLYLLTKIKIYNLHSQCILIDKFLSNAIINSVAGFYLATVQVAMKYLLESNTDSFIKRFPIN